MKKLKYVKLFENFEVNEEFFGDLFKSEETKKKEANLAEIQKRLDDFKNNLIPKVKKYFPKSLKNLQNQKDLNSYYLKVDLTGQGPNKVDNETGNCLNALVHGNYNSTTGGKGIGSAWKVAISILSQLEKSNGEYSYNIGLQNAIFNYDKWKEKGEGEEKTFENTIRNAASFINNIRYFLEITKSLEEKNPKIHDEYFVKSLKEELADKVEKIIKESNSLQDDYLGYKQESSFAPSLWIWDWIKTGKEPRPISEVMKK